MFPPTEQPKVQTHTQITVSALRGLFPGGGVGNHTPPETQLARRVKAPHGPGLRPLIQRLHDVTSCPAGGGVCGLTGRLVTQLARSQDFNWCLRI